MACPVLAEHGGNLAQMGMGTQIASTRDVIRTRTVAIANG